MTSERVQRRIDRLLDEAEVAADRGDWTEVSKAVDAVLSADPVNEDALTFKGMAAPYVSSVISEHTEPDVTSLRATKPAETPTSFAAGRYTVSRFLGEGGKKKVFLAHDNTLDRDVAFALIKTEGLDDTSRERVKREAQAMGRMGTHPCIMPIYDLGEETDANGVAQPFMVQPLMGGGDVEGLIEDAEGPLALEDAIRIATQTAQGLVFAHAKGIIHRDLKPGNVWMDEDGAAKIGDFGLAVATDRSRLTVEKMMVGTVNYMPPEQATGGEVTPKADLYSLGAMLYEMSTGRVPFMGDDDIAVISQHVNTPPVAPSWHNALIPKTLDSLILRMMSKDPAQRPVNADEVLVALNAVDLSAVEDRDESGKGSLDSMAGGVFVGRHKEMDQLKAGIEEVLSGKGRMVTLVGEPGIGKTRTAQELATYAAMRGAEVLWGRSYESGGAPPYWPWVQAIRGHVAATDPQVLRNQLGSTGPAIAEIVSDIREKLPDIPGATPIEDPESARFRLFDSISTFLKNTASGTPLVLMLEDLHWADKPSLLLLEFVARELANSRILIVGNYRDMELNRRHPLSVTLGDLSRERLFERVVLRGLQKHDVQRFIEIAAGITAPPALVETVFKQTEGNPLFVTETVRLLIQEGDITSGQSSKGGTTSWEIRIPEGVREVIGRRLDRLSERCNEVLTISAVIGRQFRFGVLKMLAEDTTDGQLLDAMDEALSARIIEELQDEVGFYQFTHASMQETLIQEISHTRAVRMHARIAEALEAHYGDAAEEHAEELVEHFSNAEVVLGSDKLVHYSLVGGLRSLASVAPDQAEKLFQIGILAFGNSEPGEKIAALYGGLGQAQISTLGRNDLQQAIDNLTRSFDMYLQLERPVEAVRVAMSPMMSVHGPTGMADLLERALQLVVEGSIEEGRLLAEYGLWVSHERADYETAKDSFSKALTIARRDKNEYLELRVHSNFGPVNSFHLNNEGRLSSALETIRLASKLDDPVAVDAHFHAAQEYLIRGDLPTARKHAAATIPLADRSRNVFYWTSAMNANASVEMAIGNFNEARRFIERGLELSPTEMRLVNQQAILESRVGNFEKAINLLGALEYSSAAGLGAIFGAPFSISSKFEQKAWEKIESRFIETLVKVIWSVGLSLDAIHRNDKALANKILHIPLRREDITPPFPWLTGALTQVVGKIDEAEEQFDRASLYCRASGYGPMLAEALYFHSVLLLERNNPGDHEKAVELQDEAISLATELGMKPLLERVLAKREILKA